MKHGFAAAALLGLVACAPVVTHGPRVAPGLSVGLTSGVAPATVCDSCAGMLPAMGVVGRWGFTAGDPGRPSVQVGLGLKLGDVEGDLYVQAPSDGAAAYGAGVMATGYFVMPYVQWGLDRPSGTGFYTTQGFAVGTHSVGGLQHERMAYDEILPRFWSPAFAVRLGGRRALHLYVAGMVGSYSQRIPGGTGERHPLRTVTAGATVETVVGRPRIPRQPPMPPLGPPPHP
jgi:hypothetical protein